MPATAATSDAADDARPCLRLLAGARRLDGLFGAPRRLAVLLAARLLAARLRLILVIVLARGGRGRRRRLVGGDAAFALQDLAGLAFDRADAAGMLGKFAD